MTVREGSNSLVLEGHVAVANPLWKLATGGVNGLAIFQGPQAYVHPGWYETKHSDGKAVPTWNYVAVQVRGLLMVERDPAWLRSHVAALTDVNEIGRAEPWALSDAPEDYVDAMLRGIVGLRLQVDTIEGIWKMSQNHVEANRLGVIEGLSAALDPAAHEVAVIMKQQESR